MEVPAENPADSPLPEPEGDAVPHPPTGWRHYMHAYGGPLLALVAVGAASYLFYLQIREHSPTEIYEKARQIPLGRYIQALGLIGIHYIIFALYEQVGLLAPTSGLI